MSTEASLASTPEPLGPPVQHAPQPGGQPVPGAGEDTCPDCGGSGADGHGAPCPNCGGAGKIIVGIVGA